MSEGKWKDLLLKSSLPLEHVVASKLAELDWLVRGQYSYERKNESGLSVDFSADLQAIKEYTTGSHWIASLDVLIECKYASPGIRWIFLPYAETAELFSGVVKVFDAAANKRLINHKFLDDFEFNKEYCIRGVALNDNGCDENSISRGAAQLRYAMPRIAESTFASHSTDLHDEDIDVMFSCALLVTTAPLYCLRQNLSLETVYEAKSLDELIEKRDLLVLWDTDSPDRTKYARDIYKQIPSDSLEQRIQDYISVFKPTKAIPYPPSSGDAQRSINEAGDHVLVVNVNHLPVVLKTLDAAVRKSIRHIRKIAEVRFDAKKQKVEISPLMKRMKKVPS